MRPRHSPISVAGLCALVYVLASLGAQLASDALGGWVFDRSAFDAGAWWQLGTSQWVHLTPVHAAMNLTTLVVMLLAFDHFVGLQVQCAALAGGYAGVAVVIVLDPACAYYAGASGALHGLWAGTMLGLVLSQPGKYAGPARSVHGLGLAGLLGLTTKLWVQHEGTPSLVFGWLGFPTYYPAHEAGAAGGVVAVLLCWLLRCRPRVLSA